MKNISSFREKNYKKSRKKKEEEKVKTGRERRCKREGEKARQRKRARETERSDLTLSSSLSLSVSNRLPSVRPCVRQARDDTRFLAAEFLSIVDRDAERRTRDDVTSGLIGVGGGGCAH